MISNHLKSFEADPYFYLRRQLTLSLQIPKHSITNGHHFFPHQRGIPKFYGADDAIRCIIYDSFSFEQVFQEKVKKISQFRSCSSVMQTGTSFHFLSTIFILISHKEIKNVPWHILAPRHGCFGQIPPAKMKALTASYGIKT